MADTWLRVPGYPGMMVRGNCWRISSAAAGSERAVRLPVKTEESAKRLYSMMEIEPQAFWSLIDRASEFDAKGLLVSGLVKSWLEEKRPRLGSGGYKTCRYVGALLEAVCGSMPINRVRAETLRYAADHMPDVSQNTVNLRMRVMRGFFLWCQRRGYISSVPDISVPSPVPTPAHRRRVVSAEDIACVMDQMDRVFDKAMLLILFFSGCRPVEAFGVQEGDILRTSSEWRIVGAKTKVERYVPIPDAACLAALEIVSAAFAKGKTRLHHHNWNMRLCEAIGKSGVEPFTPKALRHSRITTWLRTGCALTDVMRWAGHSVVTTTMLYLENVRQAVRLPGPLGIALPGEKDPSGGEPDSESHEEGNDDGGDGQPGLGGFWGV